MADRLSGVLFLAAYTGRSQAYGQAMQHHGLVPEYIHLYGAPAPPSAGERPMPYGGLAVHDPSIPLDRTCAALGSTVTRSDAPDVNSDPIHDRICALRPRLIVYSGYGGGIVDRRLLGLGSPFLHIHTGALPRFRGSTTLYYALLEGAPPTATAILLAPEIDTGPQIASRTYPRPPAGVSIDHQVDHALRADLLVAVLGHLSANGELPAAIPQGDVDELPYYVIHPVLKHLALLSLETTCPR